MSDFATTLKQIRLGKGMSQEEFAAFLGTSKQNISRYESGEVSPKISTAAKIADKLGITIAQLNGDNSPAASASDDDAWTLRENERDDPDRKALFMLSKYGSAKDIRQAAALIDALRATNPDFYDGDDPA
ncbi:MAG: helix-turn-helix transcriptional regulator [Clostridia bacterium]|nr:helix-turn-helix transcriptional regulator [Clostridia bacterium]